MVGLTNGDVVASRQGRSSDPKVAAAIAFARAVLERRGDVSNAELRAVRESGHGDAEIVAHVALKRVHQLLQPSRPNQHRLLRGEAHMNLARHDVVNQVSRAQWVCPILAGLVMVSLLASTPAGLEASERGQAPLGGETPPAEATPARYPTQHKTVKVAGLEIFYREAGPKGAPTILLLHGFPTSSHMFRALIPALSDHYHVVAPDYPGFGHSSMPPVDQFEYTFDRLADVIDQFVQQLGLTKYSLYVMDYGAPVGFRLAVKHPERVQALIVQNGNAYEEGLRDFWKPFRTYWGARTEANAAPLRKLLVLDATKWQYTHGVRNPEAISPDNWLVDQSLLDRPGNKEIQLQLFFDYGSNPALYPAWQSYFRAHQPPALVMWGKNDYIFPVEGARPYARHLKTIETHLLDTGHFALEEDGALIAQHMRRFLIKHVRPTNK
jgi:pimeloyl-ACP methyl ester carboxylesterase